MAFDLKILGMAKGLASHASQRQSLIAENVANADTRSYRARDVKAFSEVYDGPGGDPATRVGASAFTPTAMRPGHTGFDERGRAANVSEVYEISKLGADSPNGNSVSLEDQMVRGAQAAADHEMALAVLRKSMDFLRMAIGRG